MPRILRFTFLLLFTFLLTGCFEEKIKDLVDKQFPPVDAEQHRETAIATGTASLAAMASPDVAAVLRLDDIRSAIASTDALESVNISDIKVEGDRQILFIDIHVDGEFTSSMFGELDTEAARILDAARPKLVGVLRIGGSVTGTVAAESGSDLILNIKLLPLFREVHIEELTLAEKVDIAEPADFIARIINKFADNISGELSRADFATLTIPAYPVQSLETNVSTSQTQTDGTKIDLKLTGKPISSTLFVKAVSTLISAESIGVLVDLAPVGEGVTSVTPPDPVPGFDDYSEAYAERLDSLIAAAEQPAVTWAVLSKSSLSHMLNSSFEQADLCIDVEASVPRQDFSEKVEIPDENSIDCTSSKDCSSTRDCRQTNDCSQTEDCRACLLRAPRICVPNFPTGQTCHGGHCIQEGLDPICQARKEGRRMDCERLKETRRIACEAEKATERAACEVEKTATKGFCEAGKEGLKRLSRTGNLANVDSFAQATGRLRICAPRVVFGEALERVEMDLDVQGQAHARVGVKWTPLDIVGHATCPVRWTEHKDLTVSVPLQRVKVVSGIEYQSEDEILRISASIETSNLKVSLRPSPTQLILESYNMQLACPLVGGFVSAIRGPTLVVDASGAIPEMSGDFVFSGETRDFDFDLEPMSFVVPDASKDGKLTVTETARAVLLAIEIVH